MRTARDVMDGLMSLVCARRVSARNRVRKQWKRHISIFCCCFSLVWYTWYLGLGALSILQGGWLWGWRPMYMESSWPWAMPTEKPKRYNMIVLRVQSMVTYVLQTKLHFAICIRLCPSAAFALYYIDSRNTYIIGPGGLRAPQVVVDGSEAGNCFHLCFLFFFFLFPFLFYISAFHPLWGHSQRGSRLRESPEVVKKYKT